ncbi:MAG: 16S rRNA (adenine(1518)-N(6)/adenine(1519)-N(6))-dimethyltransferase RsmA [Aphanocapsa lilacina HA4352-LM1]|jgi:16S rRNA (adenine1518-N6/adenine1519-N6)-dimethyltransferase|nr:16S rRNA (adenine(1518)-N(6)/adenine(1519)-N(6))-dimethyltransferase RsmA [Aphanocapsa lilacina HA4352-LM1]
MYTLKRFGQHWLNDGAVLDRIVAAAGLAGGDRVLEIGPGLGSLTARLLRLAPVVAVEIDRRAVAQLQRQFGGDERFVLVEGDILREALPEDANVVVANIPYNISGPILAKLTGSAAQPIRRFRTIVLLVQKELGQRIAAPPGSRTYGALSVRLQYLAECELLFEVPSRCFTPPPKVDSAVIRLTPRPFARAAGDPAHLDALVTRAFATRRKMLKNCLKGWLETEKLLAAFASLGIDPDARAEDLSVERFVQLSNCLGSR